MSDEPLTLPPVGFSRSRKQGRALVGVGVSALAFVLICIVSCTAQSPAPPMPSYTTEAGKACGRTCQAASSRCKLACGQLMRGATTSRQRSQCADDCDVTLADCYSTCE